MGDVVGRSDPMPIYECCLFDQNDNVVSVEVLGDDDDIVARREALVLMVKSGRCARYEIWAEGSIVDRHRR
jgi:hypothetical protein